MGKWTELQKAVYYLPDYITDVKDSFYNIIAGVLY